MTVWGGVGNPVSASKMSQLGCLVNAGTPPARYSLIHHSTSMNSWCTCLLRALITQNAGPIVLFRPDEDLEPSRNFKKILKEGGEGGELGAVYSPAK
jgi:hypothetical protein